MKYQAGGLDFTLFRLTIRSIPTCPTSGGRGETQAALRRTAAVGGREALQIPTRAGKAVEFDTDGRAAHLQQAGGGLALGEERLQRPRRQCGRGQCGHARDQGAEAVLDRGQGGEIIGLHEGRLLGGEPGERGEQAAGGLGGCWH